MKNKRSLLIMSYKGYKFNLPLLVLKAIATTALVVIVLGEIILLSL